MLESSIGWKEKGYTVALFHYTLLTDSKLDEKEGIWIAEDENKGGKTCKVHFLGALYDEQSTNLYHQKLHKEKQNLLNHQSCGIDEV